MSIIPSKLLKRLNPEPDMKFDFKSQALLDSITFPDDPNRDPALPTNHRLSNATRINADGMIESAGFHKARLQHDLETKEALGLLIEGERRNYGVGFSSVFGVPYTLSNMTHIGNTPSPCVDVNKTLAKIFQSTSSSARIFKNFDLGSPALGKDVTVSIYLKHISGFYAVGDLIYLPYTDSVITTFKSLPAFAFITDGKWHRYSLTFQYQGPVDISFLRNLSNGSKVAVFGDQIEIGSEPSSLIHPNALGTEVRLADDFTLPFTGDEETSEGSMSIGFTPIAEVSTQRSIYLIKNEDDGAFPELEIGSESNFELTIVSDTTWAYRDLETNTTGPAVAANHAFDWTNDIAGATWIWKTADPSPTSSVIYFKKTFVLEDEPVSATIEIASDDDYAIIVNGMTIATGDNAWTFVTTYTGESLLGSLKKAENEIVISVLNNGGGRAGLLFKMDVSCKKTNI